MMGQPQSIARGDKQKGKPIRIMIADNDLYVREGLSTYFRAQGNIELVAEARSGLDVVKKYLQVKPDIILMDLLLPGVNGIDVMKAIQAYNPEVVVIFITNSRGAHLHEAAQVAGAARLLNKGIPGEELVNKINEVMIEHGK